MYNKERIELIVKEWFEFKTGVLLSDDTLSKLVDDITETSNTTSVQTISNTTTDTTKMKAGWYSYNFNTYYLDYNGVKHYR